jgi:hypothetical protein
MALRPIELTRACNFVHATQIVVNGYREEDADSRRCENIVQVRQERKGCRAEIPEQGKFTGWHFKALNGFGR